MTALRIVDVAPPRRLAELYEKAEPALGVRAPTRAEAVALIESLERFHAEPLPELLTRGLRDAMSGAVTAAEWRESLGGADAVIGALREAMAALDGAVVLAADRALATSHPDLAARARRARDGARARIADRIDAVEHLRDRTSVRIAQLEGRSDEAALERVRQRARAALADADARQAPISDDEASALVRGARRAG